MGEVSQGEKGGNGGRWETGGTDADARGSRVSRGRGIGRIGSGKRSGDVAHAFVSADAVAAAAAAAASAHEFMSAANASTRECGL